MSRVEVGVIQHYAVDDFRQIGSPLVLSDRLITLAQEADHAGFRTTAQRLVRLALAACTSSADGRNAARGRQRTADHGAGSKACPRSQASNSISCTGI